MRLATLRNNKPAVLMDEGAVLLEDLGFQGSMLKLIQDGPETLEEVRRSLAQAEPKSEVALSDLAAPLSHPSKIVAIGLNYRDHARETGAEPPPEPLIFTKFPSSITGPSDPISIPRQLTQQVDYEVELGVVIGRTARNVPLTEALDHVFGYTVLNDISARDLQFGDVQWVRGKSLDTFCPVGPVIVTADEVPDPQTLRLGCAVNGETLQDGTTADMIFGVAGLVSRISHWFTLEPGDIIATGTPSGVGFTRKPPIFLKDGDEVRTWVEGIGELINPVVEV